MEAQRAKTHGGLVHDSPPRKGHQEQHFPIRALSASSPTLKLPCAEHRHWISPKTIIRVKRPALPIWTDCFFAVIQRIAIVVERDSPTLGPPQSSDMRKHRPKLGILPC